MTFVTDNECERALDYLRDHSPVVGKLKARAVRMDEERKVAREMAFLAASGSVAERNAVAVNSEKYRQAIAQLEEATMDYETARLLWRAAEIKVEVWRSLNSRANRGHV